jgi:hypothetical protein
MSYLCTACEDHLIPSAEPAEGWDEQQHEIPLYCTQCHEIRSFVPGSKGYIVNRDPKRWAEVTIQSDGLGVSLYTESEPAGSYVNVVDETWLSRAEVEEHRAADKDNIILDDE